MTSRLDRLWPPIWLDFRLIPDGFHRPYKQPCRRHRKVVPKPPKMTPKSTLNHLKPRLCAKVVTCNPLHRHREWEPRASQGPPKTLKKDIRNFTRFLMASFDAQGSENDSQSVSNCTSFLHLFGAGFDLDSKCASGLQNSLKRRAPGVNIGSKYGLRASKSLPKWPPGLCFCCVFCWMGIPASYVQVPLCGLFHSYCQIHLVMVWLGDGATSQ